MIVQVTDVRKRFGDNEVLKGVSVEVETGEVIAIIGASGSGKSTLLRTINGLETIDSGEIVVNGVKVHERNSAHQVHQHVGMVFQQFNLFPHKTALQNVTLAPQRVLGKSKAEAEERGRALLERVGLGDQLGQYP